MRLDLQDYLCEEHTADFAFKNLQSKISLVFYATTFSSGILLVPFIFNPELRILAIENTSYLAIFGAVFFIWTNRLKSSNKKSEDR